MHILFVWTGIVLLIAVIAVVVGITDVAPGASEMARIVFYLILATSLILLRLSMSMRVLWGF